MYDRTSHSKLLNELGWATLETRRTFYKMNMFYKMLNQCSPDYITRLIPEQRRETTGRYSLRNQEELTIPMGRLASFKSSFIPDIAKLWNNLTPTLKQATSLGTFKNKLKKQLFPSKINMYSELSGKDAINLCRMRLGLSALNQQRKDYHLIEEGLCTLCYSDDEDTNHYFLFCPHHAAHRGQLIRELGRLLQPAGISPNNINSNTLVNIILHGCPLITEKENLKLYKCVTTYIEKTNRFI